MSYSCPVERLIWPQQAELQPAGGHSSLPPHHPGTCPAKGKKKLLHHTSRSTASFMPHCHTSGLIRQTPPSVGSIDEVFRCAKFWIKIKTLADIETPTRKDTCTVRRKKWNLLKCVEKCSCSCLSRFIKSPSQLFKGLQILQGSVLQEISHGYVKMYNYIRSIQTITLDLVCWHWKMKIMKIYRICLRCK